MCKQEYHLGYHQFYFYVENTFEYKTIVGLSNELISHLSCCHHFAIISSKGVHVQIQCLMKEHMAFLWTCFHVYMLMKFIVKPSEYKLMQRCQYSDYSISVCMYISTFFHSLFLVESETDKERRYDRFMSCEFVATGLINFLPVRNCFFSFFLGQSHFKDEQPLSVEKIVFALVPHCFVMILKKELRYL